MTTTVVIVTDGNRNDMIFESVNSVLRQTVKTNMVVYYGQDHGGPFYDLNRIVSTIDTDTFIILADDDKIDPTFVEKTQNMMINCSADIVSTLLENFGSETGIHSHDRYPWATSLCKTIWFNKVGGWKIDVGVAADMDFWMECLKLGAKWVKVPEPLFKYRKHPGQLSNRCDWNFTNKIMNERWPK